MLKLKKVTASRWNGNGMGNSKADWSVVGHENIIIRNLSGSWFALDTNEYTMLEHMKVFQRIARADTRKELLDILTNKIEGSVNA